MKPASSSQIHRGFTLIEVIVSLAIFISVMTVAAASMLSIIDANRKSQATNTAVDNLSFVVDDMSRTIRTGRAWAITNLSGGNTGISFLPQGGSVVNGVYSTGDLVSYFLQNGQIMVQMGSAQPQALTNQSLVVDTLSFVLDPQTNGSLPAQPFLHLYVKAHSNDSTKYRSDVNISTTISQRTLNR